MQQISRSTSKASSGSTRRKTPTPTGPRPNRRVSSAAGGRPPVAGPRQTRRPAQLAAATKPLQCQPAPTLTRATSQTQTRFASPSIPGPECGTTSCARRPMCPPANEVSVTYLLGQLIRRPLVAKRNNTPARPCCAPSSPAQVHTELARPKCTPLHRTSSTNPPCTTRHASISAHHAVAILRRLLLGGLVPI